MTWSQAEQNVAAGSGPEMRQNKLEKSAKVWKSTNAHLSTQGLRSQLDRRELHGQLRLRVEEEGFARTEGEFWGSWVRHLEQGSLFVACFTTIFQTPSVTASSSTERNK